MDNKPNKTKRDENKDSDVAKSLIGLVDVLVLFLAAICIFLIIKAF